MYTGKKLQRAFKIPARVAQYKLSFQQIKLYFAVADPGPLMLGVLDRWTPTVNVFQTLIALIRSHIELWTIEARGSISLYITHLSIWPSGFRDFFSLYFV